MKVWTELPPKTQTGANTMGCLVDGKLWATGKLPGSFKFPAMSARYLDYGEYVHLNFHAQGNVGRIALLLKIRILDKMKQRLVVALIFIPNVML